ncbi:hypothetical protein E2542_SST19608 [Spatholobus suberectus]|nr:hypothetical protein E2542_SST19608 [Spatholobus suberectus]
MEKVSEPIVNSHRSSFAPPQSARLGHANPADASDASPPRAIWRFSSQINTFAEISASPFCLPPRRCRSG